MSFMITGLAVDQFKPLFGLSDGELESRGVIRKVADTKPGYPCRITLEDAEPGETVLLLNYEHQQIRPIGLLMRSTSMRTPVKLVKRLMSCRAY